MVLRNVSAEHTACYWAVVQQDYHEEEQQCVPQYGTMPVELEAYRTTERAERWAFMMAFKYLPVLARLESDNSGIVQSTQKEKTHLLFQRTRTRIVGSWSGFLMTRCDPHSSTKYQ